MLSPAQPLLLPSSPMCASMQSNSRASLIMPPLDDICWHHKLVPCRTDIEALHESEEIQRYSFGKLSTTCHLDSLLLLKLACTGAGSLSDMQHDTKTVKLQGFLVLPPLQTRPRHPQWWPANTGRPLDPSHVNPASVSNSSWSHTGLHLTLGLH